MIPGGLVDRLAPHLDTVAPIGGQRLVADRLDDRFGLGKQPVAGDQRCPRVLAKEIECSSRLAVETAVGRQHVGVGDDPRRARLRWVAGGSRLVVGVLTGVTGFAVGSEGLPDLCDGHVVGCLLETVGPTHSAPSRSDSTSSMASCSVTSASRSPASTVVVGSGIVIGSRSRPWAYSRAADGSSTSEIRFPTTGESWSAVNTVSWSCS